MKPSSQQTHTSPPAVNAPSTNVGRASNAGRVSRPVRPPQKQTSHPTSSFPTPHVSSLPLPLKLLFTLLLLVLFLHPEPVFADVSFSQVVAGVQPKMVKVYGAGGRRGLEAYQSGFVISAEGHILTVWSYVLDSEVVTVVLDDGRRFEAQLLGADPRTEIAVLKIPATELEFFDLDQAIELEPGARVLAFSNLFNVATGDEPASVLHGIVSATAPLQARRGAFDTTYDGRVYVLDAMTNNPGAGGGALTDRRGQLAALLGKELRNRLDNTWLNYALPIDSLRESVKQIQAGAFQPAAAKPAQRLPADPVTLALLGIQLVPDVLAKTPPFIERIVPGSPAAEAGLQRDDVILLVNDQIVGSAKELKQALRAIDRIDEVRFSIQRGRELREVTLFAPATP